jgi:prefoldin subunit 5
MKRMSIAEQTLKKQIETFKSRHAKLSRSHNDINSQMLELSHVINELDSEMFRLEQARKKTSEVRKS